MFHALRETTTSKTGEETFLQRSSLLELINLIDVETQNQAYLHMDDIETTYLSLIGSEVLETHVPAFSRKWLKERILTDLPQLVSVRPNRKKPAVLYSPDAREKDMVTTTMTAGKEEGNIIKTIYKAAQIIRKSIATFTKTKERNVIKVSSDIGDVPAELHTLIHWIMVGSAEKLPTTRRILKCTHYKRALHAHIYSYVALSKMALEEFFKDNSQLKDVCLKATEGVEAACSEGKDTKAESMKQANSTLLEALTTAEVITAFQKWKEQKSQNAMFKAMMNYLHRVKTILSFIAATRNADLELRLQAGEALSKLFFAMDRIKYKRLWPRYIADMHDLRTNHRQTWEKTTSRQYISHQECHSLCVCWGRPCMRTPEQTNED